MKKKSRIKQIAYVIEYALILSIRAVFMIVPLRVVSGFMRVLGYFVFYFLRLRREETIGHLREAFGDEMDEAELVKTAREVYVNIGLSFAELLLMQKLRKRLDDIIDMSDVDVLKRSMEAGRGVIIISAHFGSWEMSGASIALRGLPVTVVAKKQSNPYVDQLINKTRIDMGMNIISHGAPLKQIIRAINNKDLVGLISDQDSGRKGIFVWFFGRMASTPRGGGQLSLKYNVPVILSLTVRVKPWKFKNIIRDVPVLDGDTVETLTQRYTHMIEDTIRRYPDQYFWMHRRWKTQPTGNESGDGKYLSQTKTGI